MEEKTFSVSQVNNLIKNIIDSETMLENILILGEISSFSITRDIAYFTIKDENSMLSCVLFSAEKYSSTKIGDLVLVRGSIKFYAKGGKLTFNANNIEQYGKGALYQQFLLLKDKLEKEGLFSHESKKPLPSSITRVGVVTSKTGAVLQDILNVTSRRNPLLNIVLYDVQVQGVYAKQQIIDGINFFSNYDGVDLVIVARGGGSIEDLQSFNEEDVARACYNCNKPIISAVGHETDFTIIDYVSDLRAPTPSAAAELISQNIEKRQQDSANALIKINKSLINQIENNYNMIKLKQIKIENIVQTNVQDVQILTNQRTEKLNNLINKYIQDKTYSVGLLINTLDNVSPTKLLSRGYSMTTKNGNVINDFKILKIDDIIETKLKVGSVTSRVTEIKES